MKISTCENGKGDTIIILGKKEGQTLAQMVEYASEANPRKKNFKKIQNQIDSQLCCY